MPFPAASPRVLIVEDEVKVANFIKKGLETQAFVAEVAPDGGTAKQLLDTRTYDLIILDIGLPDIIGLELCAYIRTNKPAVPVLMLTALGTIADKLSGFDAGADDYLVKPFDFMELLARIKVLLKRGATVGKPQNRLVAADLELDLDAKTAHRGGQDITLTAREFALLEYLMRNQGRVVSRVDIAESVWDINFDTGTNIIDVYMNYVRNKVDKGFAVRLIHTVVGMGYIMKEK